MNADLGAVAARFLTEGAMPLARSTPHQRSTSAAPEEVDLAKAMSRALAEVVMGDVDRHALADRIEVVAAGLVGSLRQTPTIVEGVTDEHHRR